MPEKDLEHEREIAQIVKGQWDNGNKWTRLKLFSPIHTLKTAYYIKVWRRPKMWPTILYCFLNDFKIAYLILRGRIA